MGVCMDLNRAMALVTASMILALATMIAATAILEVVR